MRPTALALAISRRGSYRVWAGIVHSILCPRVPWWRVCAYGSICFPDEFHRLFLLVTVWDLQVSERTWPFQPILRPVSTRVLCDHVPSWNEESFTAVRGVLGTYENGTKRWNLMRAKEKPQNVGEWTATDTKWRILVRSGDHKSYWAKSFFAYFTPYDARSLPEWRVSLQSTKYMNIAWQMYSLILQCYAGMLNSMF